MTESQKCVMLHGCAKGGCLHYGGTPPWRKPWKPYAQNNRILLRPAQRLWLIFAGRILHQHPWRMIGCSAGDYFKAWLQTWVSVCVMRMLNNVPLRPLRHRYDEELKYVWSHREIRALLPEGVA